MEADRQVCLAHKQDAPFFSVCIPLYNRVDLVSQAIESVLQQSWQDFEIVIVDDGSTDSGPKLVDSYSSNDERIHVVHQTNSGLFHARMVAFGKANGTYIISLDADDYLESDALDVLARTILKSGADLLIYNYYTLTSKGKRQIAEALFPNGSEWEENKAEVLKAFALTSRLNSIWSKAFKRDLLNLSALEHYPRICMAEDWIHSFYPMINAKKIVYISKPLINYRILKGSLTSNFDFTLWPTLRIIHQLEKELAAQAEYNFFSDNVIDQRYLSQISKLIAYGPGKISSFVKYRQLLDELSHDGDLWDLYRHQRHNLGAIYCTPFLLLRARMYGMLYVFKNATSYLYRIPMIRYWIGKFSQQLKWVRKNALL